MGKIKLTAEQMQQKAVNVMIATAFINECETWANWVKKDLPLDLRIKADNVAIACRRFRVAVAGADNLDILTDFSEVFSEMAQLMIAEPDRTADLLSLVKAFKNNEVKIED